MRKACSLVLSLLMVFSLAIVESGCTSSQFNTAVTTINGQLPAVEKLAAGLATLTGSGEVLTITHAVAGIVAIDLPLVQGALHTYLANKNAGTKNAIFAAVTALTGDVNAQVLQANRVLNPQTDQEVLKTVAAIAVVVNGFQLVLAPFFNKTVSARNSFQQVAPYIPRDMQEQMAALYGTSLSEMNL